MRLQLKLTPEDFVVEEELRALPGTSGDFAIYRVTKRMLTTPDLQARLAAALGVPPRSVVFPALKDRRAVATQHFSVRGRWPDTLSGEGFSARFAGRLERHLSPADLAGNRFLVTLHSLSPPQAEALAERLSELGKEGLPNYFDEQRFGSRTRSGTFAGKAILQGDAEGALRAYLSEPMPGDSPELREFKTFARDHWRDWPALFERAPRSNHRSVLTFLKDHTEDFRKALNLVTPRLLPLFLEAYQSYLWNEIASRVLEPHLSTRGERLARLEIAGRPLAVYRALPTKTGDKLRQMALPLPHHRAAYTTLEVESTAMGVLAAEGLSLPQLKARLLKRAYLPSAARRLLLFPERVEARVIAGAESGVRASFFLPPGSYATLVLKIAAATADV